MSQYRSRLPKMWLIIFVTFCISFSAGRVVDGKNILIGEDDSLVLPEKYTVKATKTSLTSNLIEEFILWKSPDYGRIDQGYVTTIIEESNYRKAYEYYPETDKDENVQYECIELDKEDADDITIGIPNIEDEKYEMIGNETVLGHEATRFESIHEYNYTESYYTLWATETSDGDESVWVPIRYEEKEYNIKLGALTKHEIWDLYEFSVDFDEDEVYDITALGCDESKTVKVTQDSDAVVKDLKFINPDKEEHVDHVFNSFKSKFNRKYAHEEEQNLRKNIFQQNMRLISSTNRQNLGYKLAVNQFTDRTPEERKKTGYRRRTDRVTGSMPFPYTQETLDALAATLPKEVDLRVEGLVSPVKNQENCGSCWAFATTSAVEGALARVNGGKLMALSKQALIDCAWGYGALGCHGADDVDAYKWMKDYGLPTEEEYGPYLDQNGYCHIENMTTLYSIKGYTKVTPTTKQALKVAVFKHGPLSVAIHATDKFGFYSSGVYYDEDCQTNEDSLNHEVTLVGYGVEYGKLFWVLKNSYGPEWGIEGYMLISAKKDCGVTTEPTYVVI